MKFSLNSKSSPAHLICFYYEKSKKLQFGSCSNPEAKADITSQFQAEEIKASFGEMVFYRNAEEGHGLYVGLGDGKITEENLRELTGKIYKKLAAERVFDVSLSLEALPFKDKVKAIAALTEGFVMSSYSFDTFKKAPKKAAPEMHVHYKSKSTSAAIKNAMAEAEILGEGVNFARWLGDCPGNFMNPTQLATEAKNAAKGTKMKVTIWDKARIAKEKMDSLIGVSNGSDQEPRFIIMEYKGAAASKKPISFVGKGLTFDAGGISLKPSAGMEEMKFDMCGGSAVIGAMKTIAQLKLKVNVIAYVAASENMPGPSANKPGDIRKARNGKSIEINNTDAEGRLILADALVYASEQKPAWICDAATLTGAMMIALGNTHTGFFTRSKKMLDLIKKAGEQTAENVWHMPLTDHHSKDMKGTYADLTNLAPSRHAGSATAAAFLENFVENDVPWAHFDVAGTAWHVGNRLSYAPSKGASGVMVRTFVQMARNHR
jgi:leucyl aminopeptidase